ncbi:hypothetical protein QC760_009134 [Botrytis cinerea]
MLKALTASSISIPAASLGDSLQSSLAVMSYVCESIKQPLHIHSQHENKMMSNSTEINTYPFHFTFSLPSNNRLRRNLTCVPAGQLSLLPYPITKDDDQR